MTKLKPCPFCGSELIDEYEETRDPFREVMRKYVIGCMKCGCSIVGYSRESYTKAAEDALELWNTRYKPTCQNRSLDRKWLMCSYCGAFTQVTDCTDVLGARYCGNCGFRVVDGDAS